MMCLVFTERRPPCVIEPTEPIDSPTLATVRIALRSVKPWTDSPIDNTACPSQPIPARANHTNQSFSRRYRRYFSRNLHRIP